MATHAHVHFYHITRYTSNKNAKNNNVNFFVKGIAFDRSRCFSEICVNLRRNPRVQFLAVDEQMTAALSCDF